MRYRKRDITRNREGSFYVCRDTGSKKLYVSDESFFVTKGPNEVVFVPNVGQTVNRLNLDELSLISLADIPAGCQAKIDMRLTMVVYDKDGNFVSNMEIAEMAR